MDGNSGAMTMIGLSCCSMAMLGTLLGMGISTRSITGDLSEELSPTCMVVPPNTTDVETQVLAQLVAEDWRLAVDTGSKWGMMALLQGLIGCIVAGSLFCMGVAVMKDSAGGVACMSIPILCGACTSCCIGTAQFIFAIMFLVRRNNVKGSCEGTEDFEELNTIRIFIIWSFIIGTCGNVCSSAAQKATPSGGIVPGM